MAIEQPAERTSAAKVLKRALTLLVLVLVIEYVVVPNVMSPRELP